MGGANGRVSGPYGYASGWAAVGHLAGSHRWGVERGAERGPTLRKLRGAGRAALGEWWQGWDRAAVGGAEWATAGHVRGPYWRGVWRVTKRGRAAAGQRQL